jgi:hypothetical protein
MIEAVPTWAVEHSRELLLWSHGFFVALALRRGRIRQLLNRVTPGAVSNADE